jgi:hypothetical protein
VHHRRFGGNARKRKTRLTDSTFNTMIGITTVERPDLEAEDEDDQTPLDDVFQEETRAGPATLFKMAVAPARSSRPGTFRAQDYSFGYLSCKNCHNDQAFYIHHADLDAGYTFRCRVCRMEITVTAESLAQT